MRPTDIHIDDLAAPRLSESVREMMRAAVEMVGPVRLESEALLAAAAAQTGLEDFGAEAAEEGRAESGGSSPGGGFRARLDLLLAAIRDDVELSPFGRVAVAGMLTQLLKNRLLIEDLCKRHPEIAQVEIRAPIVIAGLGRSGTTHLHNLLSADPHLRYLPYWESLEPVLADSERSAPGERDPRELRTEMALAFQEQVMPHFKCMHEMTVDHAHEEIHLLAIDLSTMLFEALFPLPTWRDDYVARDQTPHYAYLKKVLQVATWLRPRSTDPQRSTGASAEAGTSSAAGATRGIEHTRGVRWVLKSPQHIEQLGPLMKTFPDATVILTHRDPLSAIASIATMVAYGERMHSDRIDPHRIGAFWADRTERMLRALVRDRDRVPAAQSIDVPFDEYMRDDMAVVRKIYALADQPLDASSRAAMEAYVAAHARGRHGRVAYKLADLGLRAGDLRERFRFYVDRFGVTEETTAL